VSDGQRRLSALLEQFRTEVARVEGLGGQLGEVLETVTDPASAETELESLRAQARRAELERDEAATDARRRIADAEDRADIAESGPP